MDFCSASATHKRIRLMCKKLTIFLYGQYMNGIVIKCSFKTYSVKRLKLAFTLNLKKNVTVILSFSFASSKRSSQWSRKFVASDINFFRRRLWTCCTCIIALIYMTCLTDGKYRRLLKWEIATRLFPNYFAISCTVSIEASECRSCRRSSDDSTLCHRMITKLWHAGALQWRLAAKDQPQRALLIWRR